MTLLPLNALKESWDQLLKEGQEMSFRGGQVLFYEGHTPYGLFVLRSGDVQFSKGEEGCGQAHFWSSPEGKVLGLHPFFEETPYCCTCTASKDCKVTFISRMHLTPFTTGLS